MADTPEYLVGHGFNVTSLISQAWLIDENRLILPPSLDRGISYDFALVPPKPIDDATKDRLLRGAIQSYFQVHIASENRLMEVYVMTAPRGKSPAMADLSSKFSGASVVSTGAGMTDYQISTHGITMSQFAEEIEGMVHRIVNR